MAVGAKKHKTKIEIYSTVEYELFDLMPSNRPIKETQVAKLMKLIRRKNELHKWPMQVSPEGRVLDGQHRLEAARRLEKAIYYYIDEDETEIEDIALSNWAVMKWSNRDYLHHWCAKGAEHYLVLQDFLNKHPWMSTSVASVVCLGKNSNKQLTRGERENFVTGNYEIRDMTYAMAFARAMGDFICIVPHSKDRNFMAAVSAMIRLAHYQHERMMQQVDRAVHLLTRCPDKESYLRQLEAVYNYYSSEESRTRFF